MSRRVNVRGIIYQDRQLFAQILKRKDGGVADYYATPGGGLDDGESLIDGLKRELIEETGVEPKVGKLLFVQQFEAHSTNHSETEELEFFFQILNPEDYRQIDLAGTSHGMAEVKECGFVDPGQVFLKPVFLQTIDVELYLKNDLPVYIFDKL